MSLLIYLVKDPQSRHVSTLFSRVVSSFKSLVPKPLHYSGELMFLSSYRTVRTYRLDPIRVSTKGS